MIQMKKKERKKKERGRQDDYFAVNHGQSENLKIARQFWQEPRNLK